VKLLLVTQDFPPDRGGIQTYCVELARALRGRGHDVIVVCPDVGKTHAADHAMTVQRLRGPGSWLFLPWAAHARRLAKGRTHVLYAQWPLGLLARTGLPTGCLVHGRELLTSVLDPLTPWVLPRVFSHFDATFPVSRHVESLLRERAHAPHVHRVAPGVDVARFSSRPPERRAVLRAAVGLRPEHVVLLGLGRLAARKNFDRVIACMPALRAKNSAVRLVLGGTGPLEGALRAQVASLGLGECVQFLGELSDADLPDTYALGDVFVLPSRGGPRDVEGFGIVFLEAAACGLPAIATRAGGIEDAVADGETGILIDTDLEGALSRLVQDAALRKRYGAQARARIVNELTWEHTARGIERGFQVDSADA
jgi:phosphatidylinositol alpha-1,6-mannosyltransferase